MNAIHAELADRIQLLGNTPYVVGMAETAVGLGAGVARHLTNKSHDGVFHHTTRFLVPSPWVRIREAHSHADTMHLATLDETPRQAIATSQDIVLVDDEVSTGRTLAQLAEALLAQPELGQVKRLHIVSLVSWLSEEDRAQLMTKLPPSIKDVRFVQLMAGRFTFTPYPAYQAVLPSNVDTDFCSALMDQITGQRKLPIEREGLHGLHITNGGPELPSIAKELLHLPTTVMGMGEFLDSPFRLALAMESSGGDVVFQSSTRSPIALGDCINTKIEHPAPGAPDKRHFLYNPAPGRFPMAKDGLGWMTTANDLQASYNAHHDLTSKTLPHSPMMEVV